VRDRRQGCSLILYDDFTLALKTTDKDMAAVVKKDSKTCIRKLILETLGDENMIFNNKSNKNIFFPKYTFTVGERGNPH
jgi:hypothetical protein